MNVHCSIHWGCSYQELACLIEKPLKCSLNRRLLQVVGAFYKKSGLCINTDLLRFSFWSEFEFVSMK